MEPKPQNLAYLELDKKTRPELQAFLQKEIDYRDKYNYSADTYLLNTMNTISNGLVHGTNKRTIADMLIKQARQHVEYRASIDLRIKTAMQELARR